MKLDVINNDPPVKVNEQIANNIQLMQKLGLNGTPAIIFNNQIVRGAIDQIQLRSILDAQK